jgi:hypothetical protein
MSLKSTQFSHLTIRLILVLAILAGMFAWASTPAQAAPLAIQKWGAKLVNKTVVIQGNGFPASHSYVVRAKYHLDDPYVRLGKTNSSKLGKVNVTLNLPPSWYTANAIRVCLKDAVTGKLTCVTAKR